jgi:hypothetical protein
MPINGKKVICLYGTIFKSCIDPQGNLQGEDFFSELKVVLMMHYDQIYYVFLNISSVINIVIIWIKFKISNNLSLNINLQPMCAT